MSGGIDLSAAQGAKRGRGGKAGRATFDKPPPKPEPVEVEPAPQDTPAKAKDRRESTTSTGTSNPEAADAIAEAKARAEAQRAEAAEAVGLTENGDRPKLSKAERQRIRRLELRHIAVEVTILHGAKLDKLAETHGTQRAALESAIDALYSAEVEGLL